MREEGETTMAEKTNNGGSPRTNGRRKEDEVRMYGEGRKEMEDKPETQPESQPETQETEVRWSRAAGPGGRVKMEARKERAVNVEVEGDVRMIQLLKEVDDKCGLVVGCRAKGQRKWELTMATDKGRDRLLDGLIINGCRIVATEAARDMRTVSFLNIPIHTEDKEIINKLRGWGVEAVSAIRRRKWQGTEVFDGTRVVKVKFTDNITSLPYSTKFEAPGGVEFFRVIHDNQQRVCRQCLQTGHILRECPEFRCFKCGLSGHYARECERGRGEKETGGGGEEGANTSAEPEAESGMEEGEETEEGRNIGPKPQEPEEEGEEDDTALDTGEAVEDAVEEGAATTSAAAAQSAAAATPAAAAASAAAATAAAGQAARAAAAAAAAGAAQKAAEAVEGAAGAAGEAAGAEERSGGVPDDSAFGRGVTAALRKQRAREAVREAAGRGSRAGNRSRSSSGCEEPDAPKTARNRTLPRLSKSEKRT